jgi:hypothetical protein
MAYTPSAGFVAANINQPPGMGLITTDKPLMQSHEPY